MAVAGLGVLVATALVVGRAGAQSTSGTSATEARKQVVLRYVPRSTVKLEQLLGDEDKERHQPTRSQTVTRYQIQGTDLGYSFDHQGHTYFLFGDTVGRLDRALDTIATTDVRDPEGGVRLDFLTAGRGEYLTIQPPGIRMGAFEVPVSGISLGGQMYVVVSTNHSADSSTDRSVLTTFTPPATFTPLRTISQLPNGRFVKMSMHTEPGPVAGLPPGGPYVIVWGTGAYRKSDAYLSLIPVARFESGQGTRYFAGVDGAGAPTVHVLVSVDEPSRFGLHNVGVEGHPWRARLAASCVRGRCPPVGSQPAALPLRPARTGRVPSVCSATPHETRRVSDRRIRPVPGAGR
jgi:hypothetical protein